MIFCDGACPCCLLCLREGFLFLVCELVSDFTLTAECLLQQIPTKSKRQSLSQTHTHITHTHMGNCWRDITDWLVQSKNQKCSKSPWLVPCIPNCISRCDDVCCSLLLHPLAAAPHSSPLVGSAAGRRFVWPSQSAFQRQLEGMFRRQPGCSLTTSTTEREKG